MEFVTNEKLTIRRNGGSRSQTHVYADERSGKAEFCNDDI